MYTWNKGLQANAATPKTKGFGFVPKTLPICGLWSTSITMMRVSLKVL
jgi:hypothetical protein